MWGWKWIVSARSFPVNFLHYPLRSRREVRTDEVAAGGAPKRPIAHFFWNSSFFTCTFLNTRAASVSEFEFCKLLSVSFFLRRFRHIFKSSCIKKSIGTSEFIVGQFLSIGFLVGQSFHHFLLLSLEVCSVFAWVPRRCIFLRIGFTAVFWPIPGIPECYPRIAISPSISRTWSTFSMFHFSQDLLWSHNIDNQFPI